MFVKTFAGIAGAAGLAAAQSAAMYTDPGTGIEFWQTTVALDDTSTGSVQFGLVLPESGIGMDDEYIGQVIGPLNGDNKEGWTGISHAGPMTNSLLLVSWLESGDQSQIRHSFRYATQHATPDIYSGTANITNLAATTNDTHFSVIYRCQGCWSWDNGNGQTGNQSTTGDSLTVGYANCKQGPANPDQDNSDIVMHDNGKGVLTVSAASARQSSYTAWMNLQAVSTVSGANATSTAGGSSSTPSGSSASTTGTGAGASATGASGSGSGSAAASATPSSGAGRRMNILGREL